MNSFNSVVARLRRAVFRVALAATVFGLLAGSALGQTGVEKSAIEVIARYFRASGADSVDHRLKETGFATNVAKARWQQLPALTKIETAWRAAEAARPGGGQELLALLSRNLARTYDGVALEPSLKGYLDQTAPKTIKFAFGKASTSSPTSEARQAIRTIASYVGGGAFGSEHEVMIRYLGLSPDEAHDVLRSSESTSEAIEQAWSRLSPAKQQAAMAQMTQDLRAAYSGAQYEPALKAGAAPNPVLGPMDSGLPTTSPNGPSPAERFSQQASGDAKSDAGGVVFDGAVAADVTLGRIAKLSFNEQQQQIMATLSTGREAAYGPVEAELFHVAVQVLTGSEFAATRSDDQSAAGSTPAARTQRAPTKQFIFLGLSAPVTRTECALKSRGFRTDAVLYKVLARPAVAASALGWAMMRADAYPAHAESLAHQVSQVRGIVAANRIRALLDCPLATSWTLTDVPTSVSVKDGRLLVRRSGTSQGLPEGLRSSAFLSIKVDKKTDSLCRLSDWFTLEVPFLMSISEDFQRLNRFAAVFAIVKLAAEQKATVAGLTHEPATHPLPSAIRVFDAGVEAIQDYDVALERKREASRSAACWGRMEPIPQ